ncbi:MAG TPA: hypothetical protein IAB26_07160, partial [Candidatus Limivivens merdigallinarum]|nr:hypothetical protein [Candidatus Limivivens merdigallinarum]
MGRLYQLLIVDDDQLLTEEMQSILDWDSVGIEKPMAAHSVGEAKRIFQASKVHILL